MLSSRFAIHMQRQQAPCGTHTQPTRRPSCIARAKHACNTPEQQCVEATQHCTDELAMEQRQVRPGCGDGAQRVPCHTLHSPQALHPAMQGCLLQGVVQRGPAQHSGVALKEYDGLIRFPEVRSAQLH